MRPPRPTHWPSSTTGTPDGEDLREYSVRSQKDGVYGDWSAVRRFDMATPGAVTNVVANLEGSNGVRLHWDEPDTGQPTQYFIEYNTGNGTGSGPGTPPATSAPTGSPASPTARPTRTESWPSTTWMMTGAAGEVSVTMRAEPQNFTDMPAGLDGQDARRRPGPADLVGARRLPGRRQRLPHLPPGGGRRQREPTLRLRRRHRAAHRRYGHPVRGSHRPGGADVRLRRCRLPVERGQQARRGFAPRVRAALVATAGRRDSKAPVPADGGRLHGKTSTPKGSGDDERPTSAGTTESPPETTPPASETAPKRSHTRRRDSSLGSGDHALASLTGSSAVSAQQYGPSAPLNLEATVVSATQIDLTWERPTHVGSYPPISGYRIWVSTGPSSAWTRTVYNTASTATAYSHTGLFFGDYRRYRVAGLDSDLNEGPQSNIAFATISGPAAPPLAARPGLSEVTLTWTPPDDDSDESILKYQVRHRGVGGNYSSWEDIDGAAQARTHTVINLNRGTIYDFQVRAVDHIGPGDEGYVQETTLTLADVTTPINLTAAAAYKEVTLTWDSPIDTSSATVEKYQVRHAEIDGAYGTWTDATGGAEARTHTVTGLTNFQKYRFQVQAVTTLGTTPDPPEVEATPLDFGMWVTNVSIKRGSNVVGERKTPVYVYAPGTIVETDTVFTLTWGGRPTDELHPDNPTTVTIRAGEHIGWSYLWAAADQDSPPVYNQPVKQDVVARLGTLELSDPLIVFDDEPLPVVKLSAPATVAEGETFRVTATLQHRLDVDTTVPINMVNPSQMNMRDSTDAFGWPYPSIFIPEGQLTGQTDAVHKQQDNDEDGYGDLYFGVNGISPAQWWPSHEQATVRVTDDDTNDPNRRRYAGWPRLYMGDAWADESGDPDVDTTITFSITLYPTSRSEITVDYRTVDGSAKAGVNYRAKSGTLTFAPREKHKTVVVEVMDDGQGPGTTFQLVANGPHGGGAEVGDYWVTGRIYDETPTFRSWPESARESGNGNPTHMSFYVSILDFNKESTYTIDYATADGTATAGTDYTHTSGTLTFEPGEPSHQLVHVPILDDSFADSGETFRLVLSNPTGGSQLNRWHHTVTGTIHDDDNTPAVSARFPSSAATSGSHTGADDRPRIVVAFSEAVASFTKTTPSVSVTNAAINAVQAHTEEGLENAYIFTLEPPETTTSASPSPPTPDATPAASARPRERSSWRSRRRSPSPAQSPPSATWPSATPTPAKTKTQRWFSQSRSTGLPTTP